MLVLAAGLAWLITLPQQIRIQTSFKKALLEGIRFIRHDSLLLRLAVVLGVANFLATATITVQVLFAQEVLNLSSAEYGTILSVAALGAITGSLIAPRMTKKLGVQPSLYLSIGIWAAGYGIIGLSGSAIVMAFALFSVMAAAMLWNVITVSWRQRRIPPELLGRVNSIYRFFGWGSMPLGALAGGVIVSLLENELGREAALRAPFLLAALCCTILLIYALFRLRLS